MEESLLQELVVERDKNKSLTERVGGSVFSAYCFSLKNIVASPKKMRLPTVLFDLKRQEAVYVCYHYSLVAC